jgi:hypothetical protein
LRLGGVRHLVKSDYSSSFAARWRFPRWRVAPNQNVFNGIELETEWMSRGGVAH